MSNTGAGPMHGCSTRLLSQQTALSCTNIQPIHTLNHFQPPILSSYSGRPASSRDDYNFVIKEKVVATTNTIPPLIRSAPEDLLNLGIGTRPKTAL